MAALKIQYFYRHRLRMKSKLAHEQLRKKIDFQKGEVFKTIVSYILKFQYRKMRLKSLLAKLIRMFKEKRKQMVLDSVILIQYHTRKFLKKLVVKRKLEKQKEEARKRRKKKGPAKYRIVNRRGKVMRVNILEEKRKKEEQRKALEELTKANKDLSENRSPRHPQRPQTNDHFAAYLLENSSLVST